MKTIKPHKLLFLLLSFVLYCTACSESVSNFTTVETTRLTDEIASEIELLMQEFNVKGVGVGVIQNGVLVNTDYYGEQGPNVPVTERTMFNVASTTKAITAEVFLRLAAKGEVSLDEPISDYYVYADLTDDPRHKLLTPRIILTHKTGFRNWPWLYDDEKLAFDHDPGTTFGYSGIGFYILAKFLEEKLWTSFPYLVEETIFKPLEMEHTSIVQESWFAERIPIPVNKEGEYLEPYDNGIGYWNPADDLHVTVEDYSKFLISAMNGDGLTEELAREREKIYSDLTDDPIWGTSDSENSAQYPPEYGYGLGWMVFGYEDGNKNIQHGGNDEGEGAMAYFHTNTKNGVIVFCNGGNAVFMLPKIVELLDSEEQYTPVYNYIFEKFYGGEE